MINHSYTFYAVAEYKAHWNRAKYKLNFWSIGHLRRGIKAWQGWISRTPFNAKLRGTEVRYWLAVTWQPTKTMAQDRRRGATTITSHYSSKGLSPDKLRLIYTSRYVFVSALPRLWRHPSRDSAEPGRCGIWAERAAERTMREFNSCRKRSNWSFFIGEDGSAAGAKSGSVAECARLNNQRLRPRLTINKACCVKIRYPVPYRGDLFSMPPCALSTLSGLFTLQLVYFFLRLSEPRQECWNHSGQ